MERLVQHASGAISDDGDLPAIPNRAARRKRWRQSLRAAKRAAHSAGVPMDAAKLEWRKAWREGFLASRARGGTG